MTRFAESTRSQVMIDDPRMHFVHVPTPGDHYSPATGSAIITLIYQMARAHAVRGGETDVIVARGTRHDYEIGRCVEVSPRRPPVRWLRAVDSLAGRIGARRFFGERAYRPFSRAVNSNFKGVLFVHNNPVAIPFFREHHPDATLCLWANNELFRLYSNSEVDRVANAADRLICCSNFIAEGLRRRLKKNIEKVVVVRNGADIDAFQPRQSTTKDIPTILFLGRVMDIKGPDLLVKAALFLAEAGYKFRLRIVGSNNFSSGDPVTPYESALRKLAGPLGDCVAFQPFVDRSTVVREFASADIFCVPSNWDDPCPLTVAEGLASGLPMVVSRRGGIPEVAGDAALYFQPPDHRELALAIGRLLDSPQERKSLGVRARRRAELVTWEHQYTELCKSVGLPVFRGTDAGVVN